MRVLVTGGGGFLGAQVVRVLAADGATVTAVGRPGVEPWRLTDVLDDFEYVAVDLTDTGAAERALKEAAPDVVCDLAWHGVGNRSHADPVQISANLHPRLSLVGAAAQAGVKRWIGLGSQAEYGPQTGAIDETCPPTPVTLYGTVKLCVGMLGHKIAMAAGMEFAWLRLFSSYGPMDAPGWLIPQVTLALLRGESPKLTAGTQKWDYLFVEDAARAVADAVVATRLDGVYNLGAGQGVPVREIVETIRDLVDPELRLAFGAIPFGPNQIMHLEADITKLSAATGWQPTTPLGVGLDRTVRWYRDNRARYAS